MSKYLNQLNNTIPDSAMVTSMLMSIGCNEEQAKDIYKNIEQLRSDLAMEHVCTIKRWL